MKIYALIVGFLLSAFAFGQAPSMVIKLSSDATTFKQNVSAGTILIDLNGKQQYLTLSAIDGSKSINNCCLLLLDDTNTQGGCSPAEIKKIGANNQVHYIGEKMASVDGGTVDGIVVAVWTQDGVEKVLLANLTDSGPGTGGPYSISTALISALSPAGWRLPTFEELNLVYNQSMIISSVLGPTGTLKALKYWSSSPEPSGTPDWHMSLDFLQGIPGSNADTNFLLFRFVRVH